jgi:DNA-binding transcriptional ArsR family regulator
VGAPDPLSKVFAALADPTRRDLVERLSHGDATVGQLAAHHDVSVQAISKHVRVLRDAGLVDRPGGSRRAPLQLDAQVLDLMTAWIERYRRRAEERYQRLDEVLAELADPDPVHDQPEET